MLNSFRAIREKTFLEALRAMWRERRMTRSSMLDLHMIYGDFRELREVLSRQS